LPVVIAETSMGIPFPALSRPLREHHHALPATPGEDGVVDEGETFSSVSGIPDPLDKLFSHMVGVVVPELHRRVLHEVG